MTMIGPLVKTPWYVRLFGYPARRYRVEVWGGIGSYAEWRYVDA